MPKRLLVVNVLLGGVSLLCVALIARELFFTPPPAPAARRAPAAPPAASAPPPREAPQPPAGSSSVVASRNLFSPGRAEAPAGSGPAGIAFVKPTLHGVVLREGSPIAYLEDPTTKRTAGYRIGDRIAGGTVQAIVADRVVLASPAGNVDVRLRDPSKPRPAAQPVVQPGAPPTVQPGVQPGATPGVTLPRFPGVAPGIPGLPGQSPFIPGRRPVPSLGRPLPPPPAGGAQR